MSPRERPVRRLAALLGAAILVAALAGVVGLGHLLRHPHAGGPLAPEPGGDPRDEIVCPDVPTDPVSSNQLYDCPALYDGVTVRYRGEAIGHVLRRRDGAWLQLNDDAYAGDLGPLPAHRDFRGGNAGVGVFVPGEAADDLTVLGGPRTSGDVVEVTGVFHAVDPRGEVAVIEATHVQVIEPGRALDDPLLLDRLLAAALAAAVAIAAVVAQRRASARR